MQDKILNIRPISKMQKRGTCICLLLSCLFMVLIRPALSKELSPKATKAKQLYQVGKLQEIISELSVYTDKHPEDLASRYYLALALYKKNQKQLACKHFSAIAMEEPYSAMGQYSTHVIEHTLKKDREVTKKDGFIGIKFIKAGELFFVSVVFPDSPAASAGVKVRDRIVSVDSIAVQGLSTNAAAKLMIGPIGTDVTLVVMRDGKQKSIKIKRGKIYKEAEKIWIK